MARTKNLNLNAGSIELNEKGFITVNGFTKGGQWHKVVKNAIPSINALDE